MVSCSFINGIFTFVFISLSHFGFNYFKKVDKPIELIAFGGKPVELVRYSAQKMWNIEKKKKFHKEEC
jgi:hypothetical protein